MLKGGKRLAALPGVTMAAYLDDLKISRCGIVLNTKGKLYARMKSRTPMDRIWIVLAISLVASLVLYARSFDNGFREDDFVFLKHVATTPLPGCIFRPSENFTFYRPGAICLFLLEHRLFGLDSGLYILLNYIIHLSITSLFIRFLLLIGFETRVAVLAGSLFLVGIGHYGKLVMWASSGGALFAVLLSMAAMILAISWAKKTRNPVPRQFPNDWGLAAWTFAALFVTQFFHESSLVIVPLSICILVMFGRGSLRSKLMRVVAMVFAALFYTSVLLFLRGHYPAYGVPSEIIIRAAPTLVRYLGFMAAPVQPSAIVERAPAVVCFLARHNLPVHYAAGAVIVLAAGAWLVSPLPRKRLVSIWLLLVLLPFTLVVMPANRLELRYVYSASMPFSTIVAAAVVAALRIRRKFVALAGCALLVYVFAASATLVVILESMYDASARNQRNIKRLEQIRNLTGRDDNSFGVSSRTR
jgi:hypothetical protein